MFRVRTASRLHFGLLSLAVQGEARRFGGAGLMVERPGVEVRVTEAASWSAEGPLAARALDFAQRFAAGCAAERGALPPRRLVVERAAPEHAGLGTGTQLGLAVGRALAASWGLDVDAAEIARRVGRGRRSGLGVHGFERGGFLVDAGKGASDGLAPLATRLPFPDDWRIVLALPPDAAGLHGPDELAAFARLAETSAAAHDTDTLCRLVLLGMVPALVERDLTAFGEALFDFNARVGAAFASVQGGAYAGPRVAELIAFVRGEGVRGVGQSSWGPTVFAVVADEERAADLAARLQGRFGLSPVEAFVTRACNRGAVVDGGSESGQ